VGGRLGGVTGIPVDNFNVVTNWQEGNQLSGVHVYDRLISARLDERIYVLEAAESIELADDVTVVAVLKEGLVYQDRAPVSGRNVTAEDIVVFNEYVRDEEAAVFGSFQRDTLDSVEATDDRTVVFHLQRPSAYLFTGSELSNPGEQCIVPQELVTGDFNQTEPIGSGPYQQREFQFATRYLYERNPTFRGADENLPYIDEREALPLSDITAIESAFRGEQLQWWIPPADNADRLIEDLGERVTAVEELALNLATFNMSSAQETWGDIRVREAIYRAFNAQEYIDLTLNGWGEITPGMLPTGQGRYLIDAAAAEEFHAHDPEASRQLLEAAGFDFADTYEITTISGGINESNVQVLSEQLRRVGVETTINSLAGGEWLATKTSTGDYDFCAVGHPGYDSPQTPLRLHHTESRNVNAWMNIRDPEIDAMIEESESLLDPDGHVELVKDIQMELLRRYANLQYIYTPIQREVRYAYVRDWETNLAAQPMYRVEAWLDV
jgi:peptide/nickel transport system substrate-binding protein